MGCIFNRRRFAGTKPFVNFEQSRVTIIGVVLAAFQCGANPRIVVKQRQNRIVGFPTQCTDQYSDWQLTGPVDTHGHHIIRIGFQLQPSSTIGNNRGEIKLLAVCIQLNIVINAGRTNQLTDDDALRTIDDKCAVVSHQREIAHEDILLFDLAGLTIYQPHLYVQGSGIGNVSFFAFFHIILGLSQAKIIKR